MDSTIAAEPATFWAMSWMTVNVVTTRSGLLACASPLCGAAQSSAARVTNAPRTILLTTMCVTYSYHTRKTCHEAPVGIYHTRNRSQLATANDSQLQRSERHGRLGSPLATAI